MHFSNEKVVVANPLSLCTITIPSKPLLRLYRSSLIQLPKIARMAHSEMNEVYTVHMNPPYGASPSRHNRAHPQAGGIYSPVKSSSLVAGPNHNGRALPQMTQLHSLAENSSSGSFSGRSDVFSLDPGTYFVPSSNTPPFNFRRCCIISCVVILASVLFSIGFVFLIIYAQGQFSVNTL